MRFLKVPKLYSCSSVEEAGANHCPLVACSDLSAHFLLLLWAMKSSVSRNVPGRTEVRSSSFPTYPHPPNSGCKPVGPTLIPLEGREVSLSPGADNLPPALHSPAPLATPLIAHKSIKMSTGKRTAPAVLAKPRLSRGNPDLVPQGPVLAGRATEGLSSPFRNRASALNFLCCCKDPHLAYHSAQKAPASGQAFSAPHCSGPRPGMEEMGTCGA